MFSQNRINLWDCWGPYASLDTNIGQIGWCHILMSYAHMTSNDAYDINIWHRPIWPILVSKEASGSQQSHPLIRFGPNKSFKIKKFTNVFGIFFLYKFWKSFVYFDKAKKNCAGPKTTRIGLIFFSPVQLRHTTGLWQRVIKSRTI